MTSDKKKETGSGGSKKSKIPVSTSEAVSKSMRSNKGRGTGPELKVRKMLRDMGHPGYRLNWRKAPGSPDICYPGRKVAIFVNGCFWHRCPRCDLPTPKSNSDFWNEKFERNVRRDKANVGSLESEGWSVLVIWECEIKKDEDAVRDRLSQMLGSG